MIRATPPYAGHGAWKVRAILGPPLSPAVLLIGAKSANLPIGGSCYLNVHPGLMFLVPTALDKAGYRELSFALPDSPVAIGNVYLQWVYWKSGTLQATQGMLARIRS